eukprot:TRINITY_DN5090_c0_g1_i1.p1 TRINITY_DN5090_c0_g1~~TRINITY_DN5090_c0_g1_i1.p1  ORF type:complete len:604 (-),score=158.97 TRINITY_DN5090_c0_g1_i1:188-1741(-)
MDCRQCNYYLCKNCAPQAEEEEAPSFWSAVASLTDMGSGPAMNSAIDNVALRFGDVIDAATQDMSEMASDFTSFVSAAIGIDDDDEVDENEQQQRQASAMKKSLEQVSPRSRQEAIEAVSNFCEKYPMSRVAPNAGQMDKLWATISVLKPTACVSAFYDQLSFANGDTSWQPRLRILYALEYLFLKGGQAKDIAMGIFHQSRIIIQHLVEVQQCAEKAFEVMNLLSGKTQVQMPEDGAQADDEGQQGASPKSAAKPAAKKAKEAAPDLLDMADPVTSAPAPAASAATGAVDLLGGVDLVSAPAPAAPLAAPPAAAPAAAVAAPVSTALPQDLDLFAAVPASGSTAPAGRPAEPDPFDPNQKPAMPSIGNATGMPAMGQAGMNAPLGAPMGGASFAMGGAMGGAPLGGAMGGAPFGGVPFGGAPFGNSMGAGYGGAQLFTGSATGSSVGSTMSGRAAPPALNMASGINGSMAASGAKAKGLPYIPAASELTPLSSNAPKDPFSFVTDVTGIGDAPAAK